MNINLKKAINSNETILWEGKPNKKGFILESIFNPLLPFAIVWLIFDGFAIVSIAGAGGAFFLIPFFLFHLMPVWLYLGGVILAVRKYHNTNYIVTDHAIYISKGALSYSYEVKSFAQLSNISLHRGLIDQWLNVGDIIIYTDGQYYSSKQHNFSIDSIDDYDKVYHLILSLQKDVYSDTQYPNDYRPSENHGYKTKYREDDLFK